MSEKEMTPQLSPEKKSEEPQESSPENNQTPPSPTPQKEATSSNPQKSWKHKVGGIDITRIQIESKEKQETPLKLSKNCRLLRYSIVLETPDGFSEIDVTGAVTLNNIMAPSNIPEALLSFNTTLKSLVVGPVQREFAYNLNSYLDTDSSKQISDKGVLFEQPNFTTTQDDGIENDGELLLPDEFK